MLKRTATFSDIEEALARGGCPICQVGRKLGRSYLELLLWGSVNDPNHRAKLRESLGFCARHNQVLLEFTGERLGVAIVQQAMLKEAIRRLERAGGPPKRSLAQRVQRGLGRPAAAPGDGSPLAPAGACPVCQEEAAVELRAIEVMLDSLIGLTGDLDEKLRQAGGLCWPHLGQTLGLCNDRQAFGTLLQVHRDAWQQLVDHLNEFIRKRDYRFMHEEITQEQGKAIERSIVALTGELPAPADR